MKTIVACCAALFLAFATSTLLFSQTKIPIFIPSEAAGTTGIAAEITIPTKARFGASAPVVIHLVGGTTIGDLGFGTNMAQYGCIEIRFIYEGGSDTLNGQIVRSGGVYDTRGLRSLQVVRDLVKFAQGAIADTKGKKLSDYAGSVQPIASNVGLHGSSNGGNLAIALAGALGSEISSLAWIVNWESPVGDGVPNVDAGSKQTGANPGYNTTTGLYDFTKLKYNDTLTAGVTVTPGSRVPTTLRGNLYFDINGNGAFDTGDFKTSPRADTVDGKTRAYFSNASLDAAYKANLFPTTRPSHIPTLQENQDYWKYRNGEAWFDAAVRNIPNLMFTVVASVEDHVQIAQNYPHIVTQYEGFRLAKARFVRLNGDRVYTDLASGRTNATAADNDAFKAFDYSTIKSALQPTGAGASGLRSDFTLAGAMMELADRTQTKNLQANLNGVISAPTGIDDDASSNASSNASNEAAFAVSPNPASELVRVKFTLIKPERVSLKIYNALGTEVASLLDAEVSPSEYVITLPGNLPQGAYFLRLQTPTSFTTKPIQVIR